MPFYTSLGTSQQRWNGHICNRNQKARTSRDSSWQLACNGGCLTAIVTKACRKYICFMTRQALTLFQQYYQGDLCVPAGQEVSLKIIQRVLACFRQRKIKSKLPAVYLTTRHFTISPAANLFLSSPSFSTFVPFLCFLFFCQTLLFFLSTSPTLFHSPWSPPFYFSLFHLIYSWMRPSSLSPPFF